MASSVISRNPSQLIRLGYVPLSDCAPIAVAQETGIFDRHGLNVRLSREPGWSSVRDKMFYGELDAAQSIAGIAFSLGMGFSDLRCEVAVPMILNLHGNAITLSNEFDPKTIGHGEGLKKQLRQGCKKGRPFTIAATHRHSSHHILLHAWLRRNGIDPESDVEIVFLPPPMMPRNLKAGHIDGYCVGEPWNSEAVISGYGWCPATSADLSRGHPEKVLLVSGDCISERRADTVSLVAALLEACKLCQEPAFREEMISILSKPRYTGASPEVLRNSLGESFNGGSDGSSSHLYQGTSVNRPTVEKASWVLAGLRSIGTIPDITCGSLSRLYREDIFHAATLKVDPLSA